MKTLVRHLAAPLIAASLALSGGVDSAYANTNTDNYVSPSVQNELSQSKEYQLCKEMIPLGYHMDFTEEEKMNLCLKDFKETFQECYAPNIKDFDTCVQNSWEDSKTSGWMMVAIFLSLYGVFAYSCSKN